MPIADEFTGLSSPVKFSEDYKRELFMIWYRAGKPYNYLLYGMIPADSSGHKPTKKTLEAWVKTDFRYRAVELDQAVTDELNSRLVKEKIEMLNRHADLGVKMQNMAFDFLEENQGKFSSVSAVRLLVEGIRVERESRGIPQALEKMANMSDDALLKQVENILLGSPVEIIPMEEDTGDVDVDYD